jgi:ribosomal protein S18 acetylase RimI-like enzyme
MKTDILDAAGLKYTIDKCARGRLYFLSNDLHEETFGLIEDVFVEESKRRMGFGSMMIGRMIEDAMAKKCYKILACSRKSNTTAHNLYEKFGFKNTSYVFRLDLGNRSKD